MIIRRLNVNNVFINANLVLKIHIIVFNVQIIWMDLIKMEFVTVKIKETILIQIGVAIVQQRLLT